jgi:hypothetical protein
MRRELNRDEAPVPAKGKKHPNPQGVKRFSEE